MSTATLDQAISAVAGLWEPSTFPGDYHSNEYLRGQIETLADTFSVPEQYKGDGDVTKGYLYDLVATELGLNDTLISEDMQDVWNHIVNFQRGADVRPNDYTLGQFELFIAIARQYDEQITANDIPKLYDRLAKDILLPMS